jgi:hypothetical protein
MLETARAIEAGAAPLAELRPDLPQRLQRLVDRSLDPDPARRPAARELAEELRGAAAPASRRQRRTLSLPTRVEPGRVLAAGLAATFAGWTAAALPFYPHSWWFGLALAAAAATAARERAGLALALAVPILPLGNVSLGLALLYTVLAAAWLIASRREPRTALLFALGPLVAPAAALGLLPLAATRIRAGHRRAVLVALGVLGAALAAGIRHATLPFTGAAAPLGLGIAGARDPFDVAGSLARVAAAHPPLLVEAAALALVALALPHARARGVWGAAALGAGMIIATVLAVPAASPLPLIASAWAIAIFVARTAPDQEL